MKPEMALFTENSLQRVRKTIISIAEYGHYRSGALPLDMYAYAVARDAA